MGLGSLFDALSPPIERAIDGVMAESFSYQPMKALVNGEPEIDHSRAAIPTFQAIWFDPPKRTDIGADAPRLNSDSPSIRVLATVFVAQPQQPDYITRLKDGLVYQVNNVNPEGHAGRIQIELLESGT